MGRAYPSSAGQDYGQEQPAGEWQALRGELVALLDQVESQVARTRQQDRGYGNSIADRMRGLRDQIEDVEPGVRHREALRSVQRAVDRFSDRDEGYAPRESFANPRDTLQSAIQQIRARHGEVRTAQAPAPQPQTDWPRFDELAHAVGGISGRLERLEAELRNSAKTQTGNVKEIAEQVGQLSHVVELLAGAVGETGQVKRLEAQIAGLAKVVAQGPQVDMSALTSRLDDVGRALGKLIERQDGAAGALRQQGDGVAQRLDDVTATMGRLADLQVQFANRVEATNSAASSVRDGMRAIEEGVRNIYDRIDTLERGTALSPADVERLTEEMARFTEAMKNPVQPQGLIGLVDALNARIAAIESPDRDVGGLKEDIGALRIAVVEALEPRFAALEMQLESLSDRVAERPEPDVTVGQLEAQVRQLVARMDQTGEQLTGLARLYSQPQDREPAPDFEAIADLVAARASEAVAGAAPLYQPAPEPDYDALAELVALRTSAAVVNHVPAMGGTGMSEADVDEIERRVSRLFEAARQERPSEDLSAIESSIGEVNERLVRLEKVLAEQAKDTERAPGALLADEPAPSIPPVSFASFDEAPGPEAPVATEPPTPLHDPIAPLLAEAAQSAMHEARGEEPATMRTTGSVHRDEMPANPNEDAPLTDKPFGDATPVRAALDQKNGRKHHPGLSYEPLPDQGNDFGQPIPVATTRGGRPSFDPDKVERPPRPASSFDAPGGEVFGESMQPAAEAVAAPEEIPSANTFIAAARRAAQQKQAVGKSSAKSSGGGGSLIARALASFQPGAKSAEPQADVPQPQAPAKEDRKAKKARRLAGDKEARTSWTPEEPAVPIAPVPPPQVTAKTGAVPPPPVRPSGPTAPGPIALDQEAPDRPVGKKESFLSRHRRPILLAASVIAIAFLTLNLVSQRMSQGGPETMATPDPVDVSAIDPDLATSSPFVSEPIATVPASVSGPRMIPIVDSLATASVDPAAARGFKPTADVPQMPAAFAATAPASKLVAPPASTTAAEAAIEVAAIDPAAITDPLPAAIESPVKFDMPPDALGPEPLRAAAANGDARAQFEIAAIYTEGRAVAEDLAAAAIWYERSAAQGFAPAQYRLGNLYENGRGVAKDLQQAKLWYQRAAEAGNRMAMHNLAALYAGGELGKQEFDSAAEWFEQAALRGMRDSQFNLGMLHARGLGVPQSLEESYRWFALAAARGDTDAGKARDDIARSLDAETVGRLNDELGAFRTMTIDLVANFAPIGTWAADFDPGQPIAAPEVVKSVQAALNGLGYDVGTPDGIAGPKTAEAIRAFERATGMSESGAVNPRLLAVLGSQPV